MVGSMGGLSSGPPAAPVGPGTCVGAAGPGVRFGSMIGGTLELTPVGTGECRPATVGEGPRSVSGRGNSPAAKAVAVSSTAAKADSAAQRTGLRSPPPPTAAAPRRRPRAALRAIWTASKGRRPSSAYERSLSSTKRSKPGSMSCFGTRSGAVRPGPHVRERGSGYLRHGLGHDKLMHASRHVIQSSARWVHLRRSCPCLRRGGWSQCLRKLAGTLFRAQRCARLRAYELP